jgi:hypothetical protein
MQQDRQKMGAKAACIAPIRRQKPHTPAKIKPKTRYCDNGKPLFSSLLAR